MVTNLTTAQTLEVDERIRFVAKELNDCKILAKLAEGDVVAIEALYHKKCLSNFYNRLRSKQRSQSYFEKSDELTEGIAFSELIDYIYFTLETSDEVPVFKLCNLKTLFCEILSNYGASSDYITKIHSTRLKLKILDKIPELSEIKTGRDILLTAKESIGMGVIDSCSNNYDNGLSLAKSAKTIRDLVFKTLISKSTKLLDKEDENEVVPTCLVALIEMILHGTSIDKIESLATLDIAQKLSQLIKYNMVKNTKKKDQTKYQRHDKNFETPLPLYVGLMIHSKTRKKGLIDQLAKQGISVPYKRVQEVQLSVTKQLCKHFQETGIVYPPNLERGIFTTGAIDNIDQNPSSNTAKESFHGTTISVFQHPNKNSKKKSSFTYFTDVKDDIKLELPDYYSLIKPAKSLTSEFSLQSVNHNEINYTNAFKNVTKWMDNINSNVNEDGSVLADIDKRLSWSGFNSNNDSFIGPKTISSLLPIINESINSTAMVRHTIDLMRKVVNLANPGQVAVLTGDQPVYTLGKQIQWLYPSEYGEDSLVMMMGPLHIEMAYMSAIGIV